MINKKQFIIFAICIWLLIITAFMMAAQYFDLEIFFVLWLIGILIIAELTKKQYFQTLYQKKIKYIVGISLLIFGYIVIKKILEILNL